METAICRMTIFLPSITVSVVRGWPWIGETALARVTRRTHFSGLAKLKRCGQLEKNPEPPQSTDIRPHLGQRHWLDFIIQDPPLQGATAKRIAPCRRSSSMPDLRRRITLIRPTGSIMRHDAADCAGGRCTPSANERRRKVFFPP
jgi:hypothetical protein